MNRSAAVELIKFRLGRGRTDLDTSIVTEMQLVQTALEHAPTLPWFLTSNITTIASPPTVAGDDSNFDLPSDFLRMPEEGEGALWTRDLTDLNDQSLIVSAQYSFVELQQAFRSEPSGRPSQWAWIGTRGRVRPRVDKDYTFYLVYMQADQSLATDIENKWLLNAPGIIIAKTTANMANYLADSELFDKASKDYQAEVARLVGENTARMEAGRERMRGDPD